MKKQEYLQARVSIMNTLAGTNFQDKQYNSYHHIEDNNGVCIASGTYHDVLCSVNAIIKLLDETGVQVVQTSATK